MPGVEPGGDRQRNHGCAREPGEGRSLSLHAHGRDHAPRRWSEPRPAVAASASSILRRRSAPPFPSNWTCSRRSSSVGPFAAALAAALGPSPSESPRPGWAGQGLQRPWPGAASTNAQTGGHTIAPAAKGLDHAPAQNLRRRERDGELRPGRLSVRGPAAGSGRTDGPLLVAVAGGGGRVGLHRPLDPAVRRGVDPHGRNARGNHVPAVGPSEPRPGGAGDAATSGSTRSSACSCWPRA